MRSSERKDIFAEKFPQRVNSQSTTTSGGKQHKTSNSSGSYSSFEEGILMRSKDRGKTQFAESTRIKRANSIHSRSDADSNGSGPSSIQSSGHSHGSPPDTSFSLGGSAVWVGDESGSELTKDATGDSSGAVSFTGSINASSHRKRRSTGTSSSSSQTHSREHHARQINASQSYYDAHLRHAMVKDTHFYQTTVTYCDHPLPIKVPLTTFSEEVGDVCYCKFIFMTFLSANGQLLVFPDILNQGIQFHSISVGTGTPTPAHEWTSDPSHHHPIQWFNNRKAHHFFGSQTSGGRRIKFCFVGLCPRFWMRHRTPWFHRTGVPLCQPGESGRLGVCVSTITQIHKENVP